MIRVVVIASLGSDRRPCLLCILSLAHHAVVLEKARNHWESPNSSNIRSRGTAMVTARGVQLLDSLGTEP